MYLPQGLSLSGCRTPLCGYVPPLPPNHLTHHPSPTTPQLPCFCTQTSTIPHPLYLTHYPSPTTPHPLYLTHYPSLLTHYPSPIIHYSSPHYPTTPHPLPLILHHYPLPATPHPSPLPLTHSPLPTTTNPLLLTHYPIPLTHYTSASACIPLSISPSVPALSCSNTPASCGITSSLCLYNANVAKELLSSVGIPCYLITITNRR